MVLIDNAIDLVEIVLLEMVDGVLFDTATSTHPSLYLTEEWDRASVRRPFPTL